MTFRVRFTREAEDDLVRLYEFLLASDDGNWSIAERALDATKHAIDTLSHSPFTCRKAMAGNSFLRELIIACDATGYVALFEIEDAKTVTVLATRHQREDDYH
jgi:plasmid stabilization system protein ParE